MSKRLIKECIPKTVLRQSQDGTGNTLGLRWDWFIDDKGPGTGNTLGLIWEYVGNILGMSQENIGMKIKNKNVKKK